MANYRLTQAAKEDLWQIYFYGFEKWGEATADQYYNQLFDRFEQIAAQPYLYPEVNFNHKGYRRSICAELTFIALLLLYDYSLVK